MLAATNPAGNDVLSGVVCSTHLTQFWKSLVSASFTCLLIAAWHHTGAGYAFLS